MTLSLINAIGEQLALGVDPEACRDHASQVEAVTPFGAGLVRRPRSSGAVFRYVYLVLTTARLTANIDVRRRRARRVRRYADPGLAWPSVVTGPVPLVRPRAAVA
ncbi:hypothetical protein ABZ799_25325 [Nocardiopsis dassonvillei]|uniref:hypothetical protein n=1 Tax=Nocardiopsis dassonvillei TaxID=2014 RepID=UPI0033FC647B